MKKYNGIFIVIEGIDGCGKDTQYRLLLQKLKKEKYSVQVADFPRYYDSMWGKMVGKFLTGEYGDFDSLSPYLVVLLYMLDQYTWSRDVGTGVLEKGNIVLSNRYFTSNVHQIAKLNGRSRKKYRKWLWDAGYKHLGLLKPDLVIFLDVPPVVAVEMNKSKKDRKYLNGKKEDEAEKRISHQRASYREYNETVKRFGYWKKVRCLTKGNIDSPEVIHERVWSKVKNYLPKENLYL